MKDSSKSFRASKLEGWEVQAAKNLKHLFEQADISQKMAGEIWGIGTGGMVSQYLNGKRPLRLPTAIKFAKGLKVNVEALSPLLAAQLPNSIEQPGVIPPNYTQNQPLAPVKPAPLAINGVAELHDCMAHFAALIEPLPPGDRAEALRMMQRLVAEPEAHSKVASAIQTLMPAPFAPPLRHAG